jgi:2,5-dioxopentanoate dehydrogenase
MVEIFPLSDIHVLASKKVVQVANHYRTMPETYHNYIDGEWSASETGETIEVTNPADTDDIIAEYQQSNADDAAEAIEAAAAATEEWANTPGPTRGGILRETARRLEDREDELTKLFVREEGKTLSEASAEVGRAINIFYYYAEKAKDIGGRSKQPSGQNGNLYTVKEPMGVVGLITPWNYPIAIPAWKMAPALATGNTIVIKPDAQTPNVVRMIFECLDEAGLPDGVANFVTGPGDEVGSTITDHDAVDVISFTGSREVGDMIYEQATDDHKRVQTEMGSKNSTVVMPSANLNEAVEIVGGSAFGVTGQACTGTERALVHEEVYDEFVENLIGYAEDLDIGSGLDDPDMGPHINEEQLDTTLDYVDLAEEEGATIVSGGEYPEGDEYDNGHFIKPTVVTDVFPEMQVMQEEVFGPFVGVMSVSDLDEAITIANDVEFGLTAGIVTQDLTEANRYIDEVDFGVIKVNETTTGLELHVPFGGMNASSSETYREQGDEVLEFYTIIKTVYENY